MSIEIGTVKTIVGKFWIHNANGEKHLAVLGEVLHEGDRIVGDSANAANAKLAIDLVGKGNKDIVLGANDLLVLDQTFLKDALSAEDANVQKASLVAAWDASESEKLSISIEDDKNPIALANATDIGDGETAAGGAASDGQIEPALFYERTGAIGDVRTGLNSVVNGGVNSSFTATDIPANNDQPVVADVTGTVNEALDGTNTVTGQLLASDVDAGDTHTFYAVDGSLSVNGIALDGVTFVVNTDGTYVVSGDFNSLAIGENAVVSFQYYAVDNGLPIGEPHASLPATVTLTITGTNDQPVVSDINVNSTDEGTSNSSSEISYGTPMNETHDGLGGTEDITTTFNGSLATATDDDVSDTHTYGLVEDTVNVESAADITEPGVTVNSNGEYQVTGNFNALVAGQTATVTFQYVADDGHGFDGTDGINESSVSAPKTVTLTITGTNDQPVVEDVTIADFATEGNGAETFSGQLAVTDLDAADEHTFYQSGTATVEASSIAVVDDFSVVVDEDGAYHVNGNFDHLADTETATVTFQYYAVDSSVNQVNGESNTSEIKTVILTVTGTNDQPIVSDVTVSGNSNGSGIIENIDGNNNLANAYNIDGQFVLGANPDIQNSVTTPHVSINGIGNNATDWYKFTVTNAGDTGVFDIDYGMNYGGSFDPWLNLYDANGGFIAANDDGGTSPGAGGSVHGYDSFLTYTFTNPGTYYIEVARFPNTTIPNGGTYTLQVSLDNGISTGTLLETNGLETIYTGQLVLTTDLDTTDTHTFQQTGTAAVTTSSGVAVAGLAVAVAANGTYSVNGNFDALAAGETATVTFTYTATDDSGTANAVSEAKTVTLTVTGTNDQPVVSDVTVAATETNGTQTFSGQLAQTDLDTTDTHTFQQTGTAAVVANGGSTAVVADFSVAVAANGSYTVNGNFDALAEGESATVTFTYTATDDSGTANAVSAPKTVTLTITGTNDQPIVSDVTVAATETNGTQTFSGQLAETDLDTTDTHTFQQIGTAAVTTSSGVAVAGLAVAVALDGTYTVNGNFDALAAGETATVTFTYTATDDSGAVNAVSEAKTVTLTVTGTNDGVEVTSAKATGTVTEDSWFDSVFGTGGLVRYSDVDITDTHTVDAGRSIQPSDYATTMGTFAIVGNFEGATAGTVLWKYTIDNTAAQELAKGQSVFETYTITIDDGNGGATTQDVVIEIKGTNDRPIAQDVTDSVTEGSLATDESLNPNAVYTGAFDFSDVDLTDTHTVHLQDTVISAGHYEGHGRHKTWVPAVTADKIVAGNATDIINAGETQIVVNGDNFDLINPAFNNLGVNDSVTITFNYNVSDSSGASNDTSSTKTVSITITGTNDAPVVAQIIAPATNEDATSFTIALLDPSKVSDVDTHDDLDVQNVTVTSSDARTVVFSVDAETGLLTIDPDQFTDLAATESVELTVTYNVFDGTTTVENTAIVTIEGRNDAPIATDDSYLGANLIVDGSFENPDIGGNFTTFGTGATIGGAWNIDSGSIDLINGYWPSSEGGQSLDMSGNNAGTISQSFATIVGHTYTVTFDMSANVDTNSVVSMSVSAAGVSATYAYDGSTNNRTAMNWTQETFTFVATDTSTKLEFKSLQNSAMGVALDNIEVREWNALLQTSEDTPLVIDAATLLANDTDIDTAHANLFIASVVSGTNGTAVLSADHTTVTFTPTANYSGPADFTYTISDGVLISNSATVKLNVAPVNDAPTTTPVTLTAIAEDSGARIITAAELLGNASDIENNTLSVSNVLISSGNGTLTDLHNGTWSYAPVLNDDSSVSFSYTITDNGTTNGVSDPRSVSGTATMDITPVNDAPVAVNDYGIMGLHAEYYGYAQGPDGPNLTNIDQIRTFVSNNAPDATFIPTTINYGYGSGDLGNGLHLQTFLKGDAATLSNDPGNTSDAIIHMSGYIAMAAGTYNFKVTADDGYTILIDGQDVATVNNIQSPTGREHSQFTVEAGLHQIEFLYWDQGGEYQFKVELRQGNGAYQVLSVANSVVPALTTAEETPLVIDAATLLANDTDVDTAHDQLFIQSVQGAVHGTVALDLGTQKVTFTPDVTNNGTGSFTYTISDGQGGTSTATVYLNLIDGVPTAVADTAMVTEGYSVTVPESTITVPVPEKWTPTVITDAGTGSSSNGWNNISSSGTSTDDYLIKADSTHSTSVSFTMGITNRDGTATLYEKVSGPDKVISTTTFTSSSDGQTILFGNAITYDGTYYVKFDRTSGSGADVHVNKVEYNSYTYTPATTETVVIPAHDIWVDGTVAMGNVLDNDLLGIDGGSVISIIGSNPIGNDVTAVGVDVAGTYGMLHIDNTGAYTYTQNPINMVAGASDIFSYTVTDADGSLSTSTLTIDLVDSVPTAVADKAMATEAYAVHTADIHTYTTETYIITYRWVSTGSWWGHSSGYYTPVYGTRIVDTVTPGINIDVPATVAEGNVLSNDLPGTDGGLHLTSVTGASTTESVSDAMGVDVNGIYGTLHIDNTGAYTYTPNAIDMASGASDTFSYTITDADGSTSSSTLTIDIANTVAYDATSTAMDGGSGYDVLVLPVDGTPIDFSNLGNVIHNIEAIDLGHGGNADNHKLTNLTLADVIQMTDTDNTLTITGDGLDSVNVPSAPTNYSISTDTTTEPGFDIYTYISSVGDPTVVLKIEQDVQQI